MYYDSISISISYYYNINMHLYDVLELRERNDSILTSYDPENIIPLS